MFDKFGEFDSYEDINQAAARQKEVGEEENLIAFAIENGIDKEDAEDYIDGAIEELVTPLIAAVGKLKVETENLGLKGILIDWKDMVVEMCMEREEMQRAVRRKGKSLRDCMALMLAYAFENKEQVSEEVVRATTVLQNGKKVPMRGPVYLGIPTKVEVRKIISEYYTGGDKR